MNEPRPPIPRDIARQVRQRCRFGCVICQSPIYDYDHIIDYSDIREHSVENLVLLCPTCHRKKKKGQLTRERIHKALADNNRGARTKQESIEAEYNIVDFGSNLVGAIGGTLINVEGFGKISVRQEDMTLISAVIYDPDGRLAIEIIDNKYTLCVSTWDIEFVGETLTFRSQLNDIFAELIFSADARTLKVRGKFRISSDVTLKIKPNGVFLNQHLLARNNFVGSCQTGLLVAQEPGGRAVCAPPGCKMVGNKFEVIGGAAIYDAVYCEQNKIEYAEQGLVWSTGFLVSLATEEQGHRML